MKRLTLARLFRFGTIQTRLPLTFVLIVLLVAISISASSIIVGFNSGRQQVINQLEAVATLKETRLHTWARDLQTNLAALMIVEEAVLPMQILLQPTGFRKLYEEQLLENFNQSIKLTQQFNELLLLDLEGRVILATDPTHKDHNYAQETYFKKGLEGAYFQPPLYFSELNQVLAVVAQPVLHTNGRVLGVLVGRADMTHFNNIMRDSTGMGEQTETYLVDANGILLPEAGSAEDAAAGEKIGSEGINATLQAKTAGRVVGPELYNNYRQVPVVGVYHWLPDLQVALMAEQNQSVAFQPILTTLGWNLAVALVAVLLAVVAGLLITRDIAKPIAELAETAVQVTAGKLDLEIKTERKDEIGHLARAFNSMTAQLRELIGSLEHQVIARTQRLEVVATLGERLSGILKVEELLDEVVNQIKDTLGYYHAHIYLLDNSKENLVVAAGTGQAGAEMKAKGHSIPLNAQTSLVARAARSGEIIKVDNVREAKDWLPNPLLPNTNSELAVPIILEGEIVGVLDVQQDKIVGLDESDANLLRSLVNQVAVTMRNARLFDEVETALRETRAVQERYLEQVWEKSKIVTRQGQYHYVHPGVPNLTEVALATAKQQALAQSSPTIVTIDETNSAQNSESNTPDENDTRNVIVAPLILRDLMIGTLQLHPAQAGQPWTEDDVAITEAVINQMVQIAETLRLFEETRERAAREQTVREITDKLRAAPNLEQLLEAATQELGQHLKATHIKLELGLQQDVASSRNNQNGH